MNKSMYSTDIVWYDEAVYNAIVELSDKHDNVIPVFGGALSASKYADSMSKFVEFLPDVVNSAKFYKWHGGVAHALRTFCHLCFVDPALVECYLGMTFAEFAQ